MGAKPSSPRGGPKTAHIHAYKALEKNGIFYESKVAEDDRSKTKFSITPRLVLGSDGLYKDIVRFH